MTKQKRYSPYNRYIATVRSAASCWFQSRGARVSPSISYCLADLDNWPDNIIVPEVVGLVKSLRSSPNQGQGPLKLHRYFHHGLSSQALLFNLIGPLATTKDWAPLRHIFAAAGVDWPRGDVSAFFEYTDRDVFSETEGQPTSIDLVLRGDGSKLLCVECKFTEPGFGGCSVFSWGDCDGANPFKGASLCYLDSLGRGYLRLMRDAGLTSGPIVEDSLCPLAVNYQFFRELLFAVASDGELVLLSDSRNPAFSYVDASGAQRGRMDYLRGLLPPKVQARVHDVRIQALVDAIEATGRHAWVGEFRAKYGMKPGAAEESGRFGFADSGSPI